MTLLLVSRRRPFWAIAALLAFLAAAGLYGSSVLRGEPRHGGSPLGITLGIVSLILIVLLILFGWRKRAYKSNIGTLDGWLQAHLYFGILALPLVLLHGAFLFRDTLATAAFVVLALVVGTGLVGSLLYRALPHRLTEVENKVSLAEVSEQLNGLRGTMAQVAGGRSAAFQQIYTRIDRHGRPPSFASWRLLFGAGRAREGEEARWQSLLEQVEEAEREPLRNLLVLARQQRELHQRLRLQLRYRNWLVAWLLIHVPLSVLLLLLALIHAAVAFYYRGF